MAARPRCCPPSQGLVELENPKARRPLRTIAQRYVMREQRVQPKARTCYLGYLRNAFLLLAVMFVLRVVVGALGVPYAVGTWLTSLTILTMVLAVYSGYLAPSHGFQRYPQMLLVGVLLGAGMTLLVIYGIGVTEGLGIANYFHAPGEGLQPAGMTPAQHVVGHVQVSAILMIFMAILAIVGFALGKRKAGEPA